MKNTAPLINLIRVSQFAEFVKTTAIEKPLNFYSFTGRDGVEIIAKDDYPPLHAPWAVDFFFLVGIHNFGYWHGTEKYEGPLFGTWNGKKVKGSDLLYKLFLREFLRDPLALTGPWLSHLSLKRWQKIMSDDNGVVELLATYERLELTRRLGDWFTGHTPYAHRGSGWVEHFARASHYPAAHMLHLLTDPVMGAPGFREDPLKKKALLFLMTLTNRPEHFLVPEESFTWDPIVDYHLMRLALRLGLVNLPMEWVNENTERTFTSPERERAIRRAVFDAVRLLLVHSGRSMAEIDNLMWSARRFCPEMEKPNCAGCMLQTACAQRTELFQPVIRTTAY